LRAITHTRFAFVAHTQKPAGFFLFLFDVCRQKDDVSSPILIHISLSKSIIYVKGIEFSVGRTFSTVAGKSQVRASAHAAAPLSPHKKNIIFDGDPERSIICVETKKPLCVYLVGGWRGLVGTAYCYYHFHSRPALLSPLDGAVI
jgi:hypothetical protein